MLPINFFCNIELNRLTNQLNNMRKLFVLSITMLFAFAVFAQDESKVVGTWLTQYGDSKVTISKDAKGKFNGEISWLREPNKNGKPKVDDKNPDAKLQSRPIMDCAYSMALHTTKRIKSGLMVKFTTQKKEKPTNA